MLADGPYVDCFRHLWPDATGAFSYWSTRGGNQLLNRGLRLDYAVASALTLTRPPNLPLTLPLPLPLPLT